MARKVYLADDTELDGMVGEASGVIWLYLRNITLAEAAALVFDPEKTKVIRFVYGEMMDIYEGFTVPKLLSEDGDEIKILLTGENTSMQKGIILEPDDGEEDA